MLTGCSVYAQQFSGGLFAGVTATQVSGDQLAGYNKTGFAGGGFVTTPLGKNFDLALEIMYIQKGSRRKSKPGNDSTYLMKVNYAEVPLLFGYTYKGRVKIEVGPYFGKLVFSYEEDQNGEFPEKDRAPFKPYEIGVDAGLSYRLIKGLYVHTRISTSLLPIRPHRSGITYYFNRGQYNTVLLFSFRYQFSLERDKNKESSDEK